MEPCTIGMHLECSQECHYGAFTHQKSSLYRLTELDRDDRRLLLRRCGLMSPREDDTVCLHHKKILLDRFEKEQRYCCNPFSLHGEKIKKALRPIDFDKADDLTSKTGKVIRPGEKLCPTCRIKDQKTLDKSSEELDAYLPDPQELDRGPGEDSKFLYSSFLAPKVQSLNDCLTDAGFTPLKRKTRKNYKEKYCKRKLDEAQKAFAVEMSECMDIPVGQITVSAEQRKDTCDSCSDFEALIMLLKEKLAISSKQKKIQLLTLSPSSWTIKKTASEFDVTPYMVKKARALRKERGILADPLKKKGRELDIEVIERVKQFYEDDQYSRMCPGQKEYVSVREAGEKIQKQKRLLLVNLRELYLAFKEDTGDIYKIGFSKFCELRPKWCVTVSSSGSHSVCICEIHQNMKLLIAALSSCGIGQSYKDFMSHMVCNTKERNCMLHGCELCPGIDGFKEYLSNLFVDHDVDEDDEISFKQWSHGDRACSLVVRTLTAQEFMQEIVSQMDKLTSHHFIAKAQAEFLAKSKSNLQNNEVIILLDFAENYSFIVQDAAQGHHWNNSQATLHPFAVYFKEGNSIECLSLCIISDSLQHDAIAVHAFLGTALRFLKEKLPDLQSVKYFSDGAASQYKNYKNFINLCCHKDEFGLEAQWHFFATSHGKSPCDGIGGTVKRLAARHSLQSPITNQILTPNDLFIWADSNLKGIKFFYVDEDEIDQLRSDQKERFMRANKVPGTRMHHSFVPQGNGHLTIRRISSDTNGTLVKVNKNIVERTQDLVKITRLKPGNFVTAVYDDKWYLGNVMEIDYVQKDILINFMRQSHVTNSFFWPKRKDRCWVPIEHILLVVDPPSTTVSARQYILSDDAMRNTTKRLLNFQENHINPA